MLHPVTTAFLSTTSMRDCIESQSSTTPSDQYLDLSRALPWRPSDLEMFNASDPLDLLSLKTQLDMTLRSVGP